MHRAWCALVAALALSGCAHSSPAASLSAVVDRSDGGVGEPRTATVMPWMCLERCKEDVTADLAGIVAHAADLGAASFEAYDLGNGSHPLVDNGFTDVAPQLRAAGLETWAMITTVDIFKIRALCANPGPFVAAALAAAANRTLSGFNFDFEPCQTKETQHLCTDADAQAYASFLSAFSEAAHAARVRVTVCAAGWTPFFNYTALAASGVDRVVSMDTYAFHPAEFDAALQRTVEAVGAARLSSGLCTDCGGVLAADEVARRFRAIQAAGVRHVGVWDAGVPASWYPAIEEFVGGGAGRRANK